MYLHVSPTLWASMRSLSSQPQLNRCKRRQSGVCYHPLGLSTIFEPPSGPCVRTRSRSGIRRSPRFSLAGTRRMNEQFLYRDKESRDISLEKYSIAKHWKSCEPNCLAVGTYCLSLPCCLQFQSIPLSRGISQAPVLYSFPFKNSLRRCTVPTSKAIGSMRGHIDTPRSYRTRQTMTRRGYLAR